MNKSAQLESNPSEDTIVCGYIHVDSSSSLVFVCIFQLQEQRGIRSKFLINLFSFFPASASVFLMHAHFMSDVLQTFAM